MEELNQIFSICKHFNFYLIRGNLVVSAHSDGDLKTFQCSDIQPNLNNSAALMSIQGTSMATPLAAGGSALVRQYFREGWHVSGVKDTLRGITPSGALLKASIIHSGTLNLPPLPNNNEGFGRITLKNVLRFQGGDYELAVFDRKPLNGSQKDIYSCTIEKNGTFKATLAWYDAPGSILARIQLVNNLDLDIFVNGETRYFGNGIQQDALNTVEKIELNVKLNDKIDVVVRAAKLVSPSQKYALVVTGPFSNMTTNVTYGSNNVNFSNKIKVSFASIFIPMLVTLLL
jgi:hypothetical protein